MNDAFFNFADKWVMGPLMMLFVLLLAAGMFIGIPVGIYYWATYKPPEYFSLRVDGWKCTDGYTWEHTVCAKGCYTRRDWVCTKWEAK